MGVPFIAPRLHVVVPSIENLLFLGAPDRSGAPPDWVLVHLLRDLTNAFLLGEHRTGSVHLRTTTCHFPVM
jgi:hypothetical protein